MKRKGFIGLAKVSALVFSLFFAASIFAVYIMPVIAGEDTGSIVTECVSCVPNCIMNLTKIDSPDPVAPGGMLNYTLILKDIGTSDCTGGGVQLKEYYDTLTTFVSSFPAPTSGKNLWNFGTMHPGDQRMVNITMRVTPSAPECSQILNKACFWTYEYARWVCINETTNTTCPQPYCGDGTVISPEQCELPSTNNNNYCSQTQTECSGYNLGTRDSYGNCNANCGCLPDTFTYSCVQGQCGAQCDSNDDCNDGNPNTIDTCLADCTCKHDQQCYCGDGTVISPEQCELPSTNNNNYCSQTQTECSGYKLGTRDAYGNCNANCGCVPDPFTYSCVPGQCGAVCDENSDCANKCVGQVRYYNGTCRTCSDCACSYTTENCDVGDGWYPIAQYQWVSTGQCTEKQQQQSEYRDHLCAPAGCTYSVTSTKWTDTGQTRNKPDETACNDGQYCTTPDTCQSGVCTGPQRSCNDGLYCTTNDRCDEGSDSCMYDQRDCSDNLFCTINERCDEAHDTCKSDPRDCSGNNLPPIATCLNNPDGISYTWDYAAGFTSACDESHDKCTSGNQTITHECSISQCGAECESSEDCDPTCCSQTYNDFCTGLKLTEYDSDKILDSTQVSNSVPNTCLASCLCTDNPVTCNPPGTNTYCVKDVCGAQCDSNDDCNDQNPNTLDTCLANCTCRHDQQFFCGDGILKPPEQCELPNTNNNNYCSQTQTECSGYKLGTRDAYGNCNANCGCIPDPFTYVCVQGQCGAVCDENTDCANKCVGQVRYYNGTCRTCSDCACSYTTENCDVGDGWYQTSDYQWVSTGQCTEKQQQQSEYRDYLCAPAGCTYSVTSTKWTDTGQTRNKPDGTACNDGQYCTTPDTCQSGVCTGPQRSCNDGLYCTTNDRCDEGSDSCMYDQRDCSDNLFCTINERCDEAHDTCKSDPRDCSGNNLPPIATCLNNPDGISYTWDYAAGFTSACDESHDKCTSGNQTITHECSISQCGAECESSEDCEPFLSDSVCNYGFECTQSCTCDGQQEPCPVPGTVLDSICYYGTRSCTDDGCLISNCTLLQNQICDPEEGCQGEPCQDIVSITDFWGGYADRLIRFPSIGGHNSSAKIYAPRTGDFSTIMASVSLEGLKAYASNDIALVTDVSGSMDDNCGPDKVAQPGETPCKINDVKNATSLFIQAALPLSEGVNIGLASYRTSLSSWLNLTRNESALLQEIETYHAEGMTCISCGIKKGAEIASQGNGIEKSIILLSDGAANRCLAGACTPIIARQEAINESRYAWEQHGVRVYVIAFADNGELATLQQIADAGNGTLVISNVTEIIEKYKEIISIITESYPTDPTLDIGSTGAIDWSFLGQFSTQDTISDFISKLDSVRKNCNCTACISQANVCVIDLDAFSSSLGALRFYDLNITGCCKNGGACVPETNGSKPPTVTPPPEPPKPPCDPDCGGGGGSGGGGSVCTPNWICTPWSACCEDGTQKRICTDSNSCGTVMGKPYEIQFCIFQALQASLPVVQSCTQGDTRCENSDLMECTSEGKWVKISSCDGEVHGASLSFDAGSEGTAGQPPVLNLSGMLMLGPWPYVFMAIAVGFLVLFRGAKRINGHSKPAFAAGRKKGSKGSRR